MTLKEMFPSFSVKNITYEFWSDTVFIGEYFTRSFPGNISFSYFLYGLFSKFRVDVRGAFKRLESISCFCVSHIINVGAYIKMARVNARLVIAFVKDMFSVVDGSIFQIPRVSVRQNRSISSSRIMDSSVSSIIFRPRPNPTGICFRNVFPESFIHSFSFHGGII